MNGGNSDTLLDSPRGSKQQKGFCDPSLPPMQRHPNVMAADYKQRSNLLETASHRMKLRHTISLQHKSLYQTRQFRYDLSIYQISPSLLRLLTEFFFPVVCHPLQILQYTARLCVSAVRHQPAVLPH